MSTAADQFRDYVGIDKGHVDKIAAKGAPKAESKPAPAEKPEPKAKAPAKKTTAKKTTAKAKAK
jgi:hypothetical protein